MEYIYFLESATYLASINSNLIENDICENILNKFSNKNFYEIGMEGLFRFNTLPLWREIPQNIDDTLGLNKQGVVFSKQIFIFSFVKLNYNSFNLYSLLDNTSKWLVPIDHIIEFKIFITNMSRFDTKNIQKEITIDFQKLIKLGAFV